MKLTPASRAFATIRDDVASSVGPPNIMVPKQIGEIFRPLRPRLRYCIGTFLVCCCSSFRGDAKHRTRNLEIPGLVLTHHPGMTASRLHHPPNPVQMAAKLSNSGPLTIRPAPRERRQHGRKRHF